jgi:uncharacterized integral membrane protein
MLSIIFALIFGLGIGYFAIHNATPVTIQLGEFVWQDIPLYFVAVGSLILGVLLASIFYLVRSVSTLSVYGKHPHHRTIDDREAVALERRVHDLEAENARLRSHNGRDAAAHDAAMRS